MASLNAYPVENPAAPPFRPELPADGRGPSLTTGLKDFAEHYDLFLVDQWGVLHDGKAVFPHARACLERLMALGKHVVILSNSGKPAAANRARLAAMGLATGSYSDLVTSGEVLRALWSGRKPPFSPAWGKRCLFWNSDADASLLEGLGLEPVDSIYEAGFILLTGAADGTPLRSYMASLIQARSKGLPLVCANPDTVRFAGGGMTFSAGEVARHYQELGGEVHYIGKPHGAIYQHCFDRISGIERDRVIAIGDSLSHDVLGGVRAGIDTAFVTDGIHRQDFAAANTAADRLRIVADIAQDAGATPRWVVARLQW